MDELVQATGLGKATVYRLYPGKDDPGPRRAAGRAGRRRLHQRRPPGPRRPGRGRPAARPRSRQGAPVSDDYPRVEIETRAQWRDWLARHHAISPGIWLITWKKTSGRPYLAFDDIVEEALAFGWVDSQPKTVDGQRSARLLTPRKPGSNWSRLNKQRVERGSPPGSCSPRAWPRSPRPRRTAAGPRWTRPKRWPSRPTWPRPWTPTRPPAPTGTPSPGPRAGPCWNGSATPGPMPPGRPGSSAPSATPPAAPGPTSGGSRGVPQGRAPRRAGTRDTARSERSSRTAAAPSRYSAPGGITGPDDLGMIMPGPRGWL